MYEYQKASAKDISATLLGEIFAWRNVTLFRRYGYKQQK